MSVRCSSMGFCLVDKAWHVNVARAIGTRASIGLCSTVALRLVPQFAAEFLINSFALSTMSTQYHIYFPRPGCAGARMRSGPLHCPPASHTLTTPPAFISSQPFSPLRHGLSNFTRKQCPLPVLVHQTSTACHTRSEWKHCLLTCRRLPRAV